jgi:hypothetical protein
VYGSVKARILPMKIAERHEIDVIIALSRAIDEVISFPFFIVEPEEPE